MEKFFTADFKQFTNIMDSMTDSILVMEVTEKEEVTYLFYNQKARELFGLTEDLLGKRVTKCEWLEDGLEILDVYRTVLDTRKSLTFVVSGLQGWFGETTLNPVVNEHGKVTHILSITRDITARRELEESISYQLNELELVWNNTSDAIFIINEEGAIYKANPGFVEMFGWTEEEVVGKAIPPMIVDYSDESQKVFLERLYGGFTLNNVERKRRCKNGQIIEVLASYRSIPLYGKNYAIAMYKNISDLKKAQQLLKESEERFKTLFERNSDVIWSVDLDGYITSINNAVQSVLGYTPEEMVGTHHSQLSWDDEQFRRHEHFYQQTLKGETHEYELTFFRKDGGKVDFKVKTIPITINEEIVGMYGIAKDITGQKCAEELLKRQALTDSLTNLPNRRYINDVIDRTIPVLQRENRSFAIMFMDIDNFKTINDSYGHDIGDKLLVDIAETLTNLTSPTEEVARLGGDEFVIFMSLISDEGETKVLADKIITAMQDPCIIDGIVIERTISIGVSIFPVHGNSREELLKHADNALYNAKKSGRNTFKVFEAQKE